MFFEGRLLLAGKSSVCFLVIRGASTASRPSSSSDGGGKVEETVLAAEEMLGKLESSLGWGEGATVSTYFIREEKERGIKERKGRRRERKIRKREINKEG